MAAFNKIPKNTFVLPTSVETIMPFWSVEQQNQHFILQKYQEPSNTIFKSVFSTITNLLDAKQLAYRVLFQREPNTTYLQVAVSDSLDAITAAWDWIRINMVPELEEMTSPFAKEEWVIKQMSNILSATYADNDTDDLINDDTIRNASRTFRQTFNVSSKERLVNYYSCACNSRQGWLYISENYLGFYSYILGFELKILIELKDIKDIIKEPARKLFRHNIRIVTKTDQEYLFVNMFKRDEVYDLLVQLTGDSIHRLLKSSHSNAFRSGSFEQLSVNDNDSSSQRRPSELITNKDSLKDVLQNRKRNENFRQLFRLPDEEEIVNSIHVCYLPESGDKQHATQILKYPGTLYQTQNFLAFESLEIASGTEQQKSKCIFVLPLYTITRFERINNDTYKSSVSFKTWHKMIHTLKVDAEKTACEHFCDTLKEGLNKNIEKMETHLRPFLATCKSEELLQIPDGPIKITETIGGLGLRFGYHSDANEAKDQRRLKLWLNYFHENGRNLTLVRHPVFHKMVRAGLPNDLRGEIWESCSGSIYLRLLNQGVYQHILDSHKDTDSYVKEEIEKDLHRSLPEYEAYQSSEGIDRLRRVLIAYSWKNPELGYCQAMNIVTSSLLIYMTEEQAFWALNTLVDHLCPGYYSSSMYGVLLDQVVLEELVKQYLPKVLEHLHQKEIQLSVACLPWFLTLYINSMPLPFAFRILDCFFLEGPKILFQIALAVLKMNEEELLTVEDDSELLMVAKGFFKTLNINTSDSDSGAAEEDSEVARRLELFNNLMRSAYTDFGKVTSSQIIELRKKNELRVIGGVESFTKRNALRNIRNTSCFSQDEISIVYDYFSTALYYANDHQDRMTIPDMNLKAFTNMFESMTTWANSIKSNYSEADANEQNASDVRFAQQIIQSFIQRLFENFKTENKSGITLTDTIAKLGDMLRGDIMSKAAFFFSLYDHETKDQMLTNQEFYQLINEFFLLLNLLDMPEFHPLDTITKLITLSAEQTNTPAAMASLHEQLESISKDPNYRILVDKDGKKINLSKTRKITEAIRDLLTGSEAPVIEITLPVFRMIILTEEHLDQFIQTKFPQSFKLQKSLIETQKGLGHEIFEALLVEGKKFANNMTVKNDGRLSAAEVVANSRSFHPKSPKTTLSASSNLEDDYELI